jgi:hypothetical protein
MTAWKHFGKRTLFQAVARNDVNPSAKPDARQGEARRNPRAGLTSRRSAVRSRHRPWLCFTIARAVRLAHIVERLAWAREEGPEVHGQ